MRNQSIHISGADNTVSIKVQLQAFIVKEKPGMYASHCPALQLCSQGKTRKEAKQRLIEATEIFIQSCLEDNTLEEVLLDCGFTNIQSPAATRARKKRKTLPEFANAFPIRIPAELPMMAYG